MRPVVVLLLAAAIAVGVAGCANDENSIPPGKPMDVVAATADKTIGAGTVHMSAGAEDAVVDARIDLRTGRGTATFSGPDLAAPARDVDVDYGGAYVDGSPVTVVAEPVDRLPSELVQGGPQPGNPLVVLDLLRGVTEVDPFGGTLVRGTAAFQYQLVVDPRLAARRAPAERRAVLQRLGTKVQADVWVDRQGRARRLQIGNDLTQRTTTTDRRGLPVATTIDLFDFEGSR